MLFSLEKFVGKVAVVTGASAGIGAAIVEQFVKNGIVVAGLARRADRVEALAKQLSGEKGKLHAFQCDITKEEEVVATVKKIAETLGPVNILVNNAGLGKSADLIDGTTEAWKATLDTNVLGLSIITREVVQNMKANGTEGHIIHINSVIGHVVIHVPGLSMYGASKYAVTSLAENLRMEINKQNLPIKVTSISPGYVKTDFRAAGGIPGTPQYPGMKAEDVADAVVYVVSTASRINVTELTIKAIQ